MTEGLLSRAPARPRRLDIEALRLLAGFGIVWFHTRREGAAWAYGGLVVFLILSVWLGSGNGRRPPDGAQVRKRAQRLLLPWAFWFAAYGLWNASQGAPVLTSGDNPVAAVLAGPSIHLWYLPFTFGLLLALDVLQAHSRPAALAAVAAMLALMGVVATPLWRPVSLSLSYPVLQWTDALVPVLLGVFLLNAKDWPLALRRGVCWVLSGAMAVLATQNDYGVALLVGWLAVLLVDHGRWAGWHSGALSAWSDCSFGVYLVHSGLWLLLARSGWVSEAWMPLAIYGTGLLGVRAFRAAWPALAHRVT